jgi:prepilin-type N-terminal cleavage/methylation domain-containing protein
MVLIMSRYYRSQGFTLVELSIVLVIIGLLAGGIMVGRDLIHAAELRAIISEVDKFKTAVNTFRVKYDCIPGDCTHATDYWLADGGCPISPVALAPREETCNGGGSGKINEWTTAHNEGYWVYPQTMFRFWQQLANAGLIGGKYSGTQAEGDAIAEAMAISLDIPASRVSGSGWFIHYWAQDPNFPGYDGNTANKNFFTLIGGTTEPFYPLGGGYLRAISSQDMWNIDTKMDDGISYSGRVVPFDVLFPDNHSTLCVTDPYHTPNNYFLTSTELACAPAFAAGF